MRTQQEYRVGIYCRLSVDDGTNNESMSIGNQRSMLTEYVTKQGWNIEETYIDDGYSGTSFERPNFKRMIDDIERGRINLVICKDLSRLGRNYILCGQYTEIYFPERNVRFIALNDGIDSLHANNDIAPFKNILNDMYAKDISVKSRTALRTKAQKGEFLGAHAPYGYLRDPNNKNRLLVNPETAPTARRVFDLVISGLGFSAIARIFNAENIMSPGDYANQFRLRPNNGEYVQKYKWTKETLCILARNQMYVGDMVQCRKRSQSYRTQKIQWNKKEDWVIVEGTHESIVSREMYDRVQKIIDGRTRIIKKKDEPHLFSGFFYCENCGNRMAHHVRSGYGDYFSCGKYRAQGRQACSSHHIKVDTLAGIVLADIQQNVHLLETDEEAAIRRLEAKKCADEEKRLTSTTKELTKLKKRQSEIDYRIKKVYEDNVAGKLPDDLFHTFLQDYEKEKVALRDSIRSLEKTIRYLEASRTDVSQFIALMKQYAGIKELTRPALMALIERITVEEPPDSYGRTHHPQTMHIHYKYMGEL